MVDISSGSAISVTFSTSSVGISVDSLGGLFGSLGGGPLGLLGGGPLGLLGGGPLGLLGGVRVVVAGDFTSSSLDNKLFGGPLEV